MGFCVSIFDNKLFICGFLLLWTCLSSSIFCIIMIQDGSNFLLLGPNDRNQLFGVKMDTWFKWWVTAIYTFVSTAIAAFASDALCPFFSNVIEDHKTKHIPYSKFTCLMIVQVFTIYGVIMSVIGMFVALTQVDFMFIRIAADLLVNAHTTYYFLRGKIVNAALYNQWKNIHVRPSADDDPKLDDCKWVVCDDSEHELLDKGHQKIYESELHKQCKQEQSLGEQSLGLLESAGTRSTEAENYDRKKADTDAEKVAQN